MGLVSRIWAKMDLMIFAVSLLIYGSVVIVTANVIIPWRWWSYSVMGFVGTVLFYTLSVATIVSWYRAMLLEPGRVPRGWCPPSLVGKTEEEIVEKVEEYKQKTELEKAQEKRSLVEPEFRWCKFCNAFKPDRTHHCRDCNRCVLMMDHHCPWVNNCVGYLNRRDFLQFLFYATLSMATAFAMLVGFWVEFIRKADFRNGPPNVFQIVIVIMDMVFLFPVCIAVGGLFFYQLSCMLENQTTIEEYIMERQMIAARKLKRPDHRWQYDLGWRRNLRVVLGNDVLGWFLPGHGVLRGDGIHWERNNEDKIE